METDSYIRRQQTVLICSGLGVISFGLWNMVKYIMFGYLDPMRLLYDVEIAEADIRIVKIAVIVTVLILLGLECLIRLYIGLSAISVGKGKEKSNKYLIVTVIYTLFSVVSLVTISAPTGTNDGNLDIAIWIDIITSFVIEATACFAATQIVIAAIKLKVYVKDNKQGEKYAA